MKIGTKSVLFGAHQFLIHPWFVAAAWTKLYGAPRDPRLWAAFFVHDLGYIGKPNMDGPEGEAHVELGARIMARAFGEEWGNFCRYHSRFYAKRDKQPFSRLCVADKLAVALEPWWFYLPRANASGELREYMGQSRNAKYASMNLDLSGQREWFASLKVYLKAWVAEHADLRPDTWTPEAADRVALNGEGVWK